MSQAELAQSATISFLAPKAGHVISNDPAMNAMLQRVGKRIARVAGEYYRHQYNGNSLFEEDQLNAFAMPGGKSGGSDGLMNMVETDDELAAVIEHEVAHVVAGHSDRARVSNRFWSGWGGSSANWIKLFRFESYRASLASFRFWRWSDPVGVNYSV